MTSELNTWITKFVKWRTVWIKTQHIGVCCVNCAKGPLFKSQHNVELVPVVHAQTYKHSYSHLIFDRPIKRWPDKTAYTWTKELKCNLANYSWLEYFVQNNTYFSQCIRKHHHLKWIPKFKKMKVNNKMKGNKVPR